MIFVTLFVNGTKKKPVQHNAYLSCHGIHCTCIFYVHEICYVDFINLDMYRPFFRAILSLKAFSIITKSFLDNQKLKGCLIMMTHMRCSCEP